MERIYDLEPESEPDLHQAYHAVTGGFILGELIRRITGLDARAFITQEVRKPLGFADLTYGLDPKELHRAALESFTGMVPPWPASAILLRALGFPMEELVELSNDARFRTAIVPSGNIFATANEIARFFELLRRGGELDGHRIFREDSIVRATSVMSAEIDRTLMMPIRYSMGFMLGADVISFYGLRSPKAFGHLGFTNVLGWADPERELSAALMNNGKPLISPKFLAWLDIPRVIASKVPRTATP
jgi:CubicO group peptidase (beta-lactamase class C family)